jgi:hypothetical protein
MLQSKGINRAKFSASDVVRPFAQAFLAPVIRPGSVKRRQRQVALQAVEVFLHRLLFGLANLLFAIAL